MPFIVRAANVPLPSFAPKTGKDSYARDIASLAEGESGVLAKTVSAVKQACGRIAHEYAEALEWRAFVVYACTADGTPVQTGKAFARVFRLSEAQAAKMELDSPGSTVQAVAIDQRERAA